MKQMREYFLQARSKMSVTLVAALLALLLPLAQGGVESVARAAQHHTLDEFGYLETVYDNSNGLDSAAANDVVQTQDGFIWIGTYNGLTRYDGTSFYQYPVTSGIYSVANLYVSKAGELYIGTNDSGLALYKEGKFEFWQHKDGLSSNTIRDITENEEGLMFIGTTEGLSFKDKDNYITREDDQRLARKYIKEIHAAPGNKVCGLTKKGDLFVYKGRELVSYFKADSFSFGNVVALEPDPFKEDNYWVGTTADKVAQIKLEGDEFQVLKLMTTEGRHTVNDMVLRSNGQLLVATDDGVGYFDINDEFHAIDRMKFNNSVDNIMVDYEDNVWFSSSRMGVAKLTHNSFRDVFAIAGISPRVVNSVLKHQGITYVATDNGLLTLKGDERISTPLSELLRNIRTRHIMLDSKQNLWIATYSKLGLVKCSPDGTIKSFSRKDGLPHERTRVVMEASDGSIYVGTRDGLALIRNDKVEKTFTGRNGLANPQVLCLLEYNGGIYVGTDGGGVNLIKDDHIVYNLDQQDGLRAGVILRMAVDPELGGIWVSTGNSIAHYKDSQIKTVENFPSTNNFDFIFLPTGEMLVTCNQGIYVTRSSKLLKDGSFDYVLSQREGLSGALTANSFNYIDNNEKLYLCLQNGLAELNLDSLEHSTSPKKFCVPSINIDGVDYPVDEDKPLAIASDATRITYKAYVLTNTLNNVTMSTYLEGFDRDVEKISRFANKERTYTNLAGGTYKLHVGIYDQRTGKLSQEKVYTLIKEKKLSEYPAFILLPLGIIIGLLFGGYRLYMRQRLQKIQEKQKETEAFLDQVISSFAKAIDLKDHYTRGHSARVAQYSRQLAEAMGWSKERVDNLYRVALLHDVGKVVIPDDILNKRGPLSDAEYAKMKEHTDIGSAILEEISQFPLIAVGAKSHHERFDGKGYGHHLVGKDIPLEARIIAVADTFDAMNSTRVYRPHLTKERILSELEHSKNTQLDGEIVELLLQLIREGKIEINTCDDET
ncbi:MAG: HD domain-containing phosphohydrolase [Phascolarctobacterium sp.]